MSGKPAARQGDMTRKGLDIVQGSAGLFYTSEASDYYSAYFCQTYDAVDHHNVNARL
ncbi:hypothetical protein G3M49_24565 [Escherichia coli]|nr:hypothetical protein [Escherichia coli]NDZ01856.1 hypothetical protein [Escherichia coli]